MLVRIFSIITFASMILHVALTMYVLVRCKTRKKIAFTFLALPGFLLLLGYLLEINAVCLNSGITALRVIHIGLLLTMLSLLGFVTDYCDVKLPKPVFYLGIIISVAFSALVWTNNRHMLFYSSIAFNADARLPYVDVQLALFGVLNLIFALGCLLGAFGIIIYKYVKSGAKERKNLFGFIPVVIGGAAAVIIDIFFPGMPVDVFAVIGFIFVAAVNTVKNDMFDIADLDNSGVDAFTLRVLDAAPIMIEIWDESCNMIWCNKKELETFGIKSAKDYDRSKFWPEFQPCGKRTDEMYKKTMKDMFEDGVLHKSGEWVYLAPDGSELPAQFGTFYIEHDEQRFLVSFQRDASAEKEARKKEESAYALMDAVMNSAPVMISVWDKNFNLVRVGQNSANSFGSTVEDVQTRFFDFVPEFQRDGMRSDERYLRDMKATLENGSLHTEIAFKHADGHLIDCEAVGSTIMVNGEKMIIMCIRDISEKKAAEENEKNLHERIRIIYDTAPVAMHYWDERNNCIDTNKYSIEFHNCKTVREYFDTCFAKDFRGTQPDGSCSWSVWTSHLDSVRTGNTDTLEFFARNYKGELFTFEVIGRNVNYEGINAVITYSRDITDAKKIEQERRRAETAEKNERMMLERVKTMFDAAPIVMQFWDADYNCIHINRYTLDFHKCETLEEYTQKAVDGNIKLTTQTHGENSWVAWTAFLDRVRAGSSERFEFMVRTPEGVPVDFECMGRAVLYNGIDAVVTYASDITDRKIREEEHRRAEVAEETNRAKSRFLAKVSHEIRTPITAILGASQIQLKNSALPLTIYEVFFTIYKSADLLSKIINDLLDLSMIESEKLVIHTEKYEATSLIADTVSMCRLLMGDSAIRFIVNVDENLPMYLIGDFVRIRQILNNLLSNAFKYTKEGEVELSLRAEPRDGLMAFIITIRDTGFGMTAEQVKSLYQDYLRFHENTHHATGSGLGMVIVRNLVALMDADVKIESEPNKGTTVTVTIPQQPAGDETIGKETAERIRHFEIDITAKHFNFAPECMHYGSVLVVDDINANLYVTKGLIEFYDIAVETAASGAEAVDRIKNGEIYDIIFMDHMMPEMDGIEALEKIRAAGYEHPVVVLTANAIIGEAEKFIACGFDSYLSKPIQTEQLDNVLTRFIRDKQPPEVLREAELYRKKNHAARKDINGFRTDSTVVENLKKDFARERKNAVAAIRAAIDARDFKKAHLAVHSLKSHAALILEQDLADSAKAAESLIARGEAPLPEDLSALETNISRVIAHIKQSTEAEITPTRLSKALKQLDILEPMLAAHKTSSRNHINELRNIPEAAILVRQVEKYDFKAAVKSLGILRGLIEEGF